MQHYNQLSNSQKKVADCILNHPDHMMNYTLAELAEESGVSIPSVVRFTHAIGFEGFSEFKKAILLVMGQQRNNVEVDRIRVDLNYSREEPLSNIPAMVVNKSIRGLQDTLALIDLKDYEKSVQLITSAKQLSIYGAGTSSSVALDFVSRLIRIGIHPTYFADVHLEQLSIVSYGKDDLVIVISHSGATKDAVDTLKIAKEKGASTIALTNYKSHVINQYADIHLMTGDSETSLYSETMVSRLSLLSIVDMLYIGVILSDYDHYTNQLDDLSEFIDSKNY